MPKARRITAALLRAWPLPQPALDADKEDRGRLLIIAGSDENPGAAILAAHAALRAGVGKVQIGTSSRVAPSIGQAVPEARVIEFDAGAPPKQVDAIVAGPGMEASKALLRYVAKQTLPLVIDAAALEAISSPRRESSPAVATPHAGEMAKLLDCSKAEIELSPSAVAVTFARDRRIVVVLKGAATFVADPEGGLWVQQESNPGLAVSGSGDVLAGVIGALIARGCTCAQAGVWGVALLALAGRRLVARHGPLGGLPRELPDHIPHEMHALRARQRTGRTAGKQI